MATHFPRRAGDKNQLPDDIDAEEQVVLDREINSLKRQTGVTVLKVFAVLIEPVQ